MKRSTSILTAAGALLAVAGAVLYILDANPVDLVRPAQQAGATLAAAQPPHSMKRADRQMPEENAPTVAPPSDDESAAQAAQAQAQTEENEDAALAPPALGTMREEVQENPHATPQALILFARQMAAKMERAQSSPEAAKSFFKELQQCVSAQAAPQARSVQALCLFNARRLAESHAELADAYKTLSQSAPEGVVSLLQMMGELGG